MADGGAAQGSMDNNNGGAGDSGGDGGGVTSADMAAVGLGGLAGISGGMSMIDATTALGMAAGAATLAGGAIGMGIGLAGISAQGIAMGLDPDPSVMAAQLSGISSFDTATAAGASFAAFDGGGDWLAVTVAQTPYQSQGTG